MDYKDPSQEVNVNKQQRFSQELFLSKVHGRISEEGVREGILSWETL